MIHNVFIGKDGLRAGWSLAIFAALMAALLKLDLKPELIGRLRSIAHITGLPLDARSITDELTSMEGK